MVPGIISACLSLLVTNLLDKFLVSLILCNMCIFLYIYSIIVAIEASVARYSRHLSLAYAFTLAWRFSKELIFFHQMFRPEGRH